MNSPTIKRAEEATVLTVTPGAKKIFQAIYRSQSKPNDATDERITKIRVSDVISKMSFFYEKIRNAVHYQEEHLLRKDAIERILKRQLIIENPMKFSRVDSHEAAQHLLVELIRAGYLPNNSLPETKVDEVAVIIDKYFTLRSLAASGAVENINFFGSNKKQKSAKGFDATTWLVGLAAVEIEQDIVPDEVSKTVMKVMYDMLEKRLKLPESLPYESDLQIQLYLAIHRSFLKFDDDMLSLILINYFNADWSSASPALIKQVAKNFSSLRQLIDTQLAHPLTAQLNKVILPYTVYFNILKDVIVEDPTEVYDEFFDDPKAFVRRIKSHCTKRYTRAKKKLWQAAWRSIIYILLTKSIFAVLLEIPAAAFFGSMVNPFILLVNVSFPAALLFFSVAVTGLPGDDNTKKIVAGIEDIVFVERRREDKITLRKPIGRRPVANVIFGILYGVTFFISFGLIIWFLTKIHFSWVSTTIFLFFLAFVSFFIIRVRRGAKEWIVVESRDTFFRFVLDFFSTPIVATGKWLSGRFAQINIFVFVLDFIIEAPFKILVDIAEEWTKYVRERKERI
ncbi:MAG: hypothetical protein NTY12_00925 [Candidatus Falkowbacteria bacterium]|nr:hypothetical protein [Candidatus Falkowbacteria bacterium]